MKRFFPVFLLFLSLPLQAEWKTLAPGLDYESRPEFSAHVFRVDPAKFRIGLLTASDFSEKALTAADYRSRGRAVLAVNGGFFDETFRAMGLLYRDGQALNPLRNAAWGVFSMTAGGARILHRHDWNPQGASVAVQVGPRLVVDGVVQKFKEAPPDRRSAVGVTADGKVVMAVADQPLSLADWAAFLRKDCPNALNLDGGSSTQIAAAVEEWSLNVEGLTAVPNALAVFSR